MSSPTTETLDALLKLSHDLGREERGLAILGEGNTSARLNDENFAVKASGSNLMTLRREDTAECRYDRLLPLLRETGMSDVEVDDALLASRKDETSKKPSVEALFHAYLLSLPGINFVGHTHAIAVNQILCSPRAREFAEKRLFPDEIVCCGVASVFVPYTDPGLKLAQAIETETETFIKTHERQPRVILLENHGIITLGASPNAVLAAMLMAEKAARIFVGSAALGGPVFLTSENVSRIAGRPDEHYRQRALNL
ncbi:MAG TPA: class II aldolase/adducin family protein [Abditibacteriaceae bacterium]|jgi:rhamnose utilization protein RhaD (predicted bifunctional aldolase and dehydrogenase)